MEYSQLGQTDLNISRIGFGCWAVGGYGWGDVCDDDSILAIRKALDLGINFFDTADVYGLGHSEEILSRALGDDRKKVVIATKFGVSWDQDGKTWKDISPGRVVLALEGSLKRLKLECIDLYQIHWPDNVTAIEDTMFALIKCQEKGKIKFIGCSNLDQGSIERALGMGRIESSQFPYSLISRDAEKEYFPMCRRSNMSALVYGPLEKGLLTGKYKNKTSFPPNDVRSRDPNFQTAKFDKIMELVKILEKISLKYKKTISQVAIRWLLEHKGTTSVVAGMKTIGQVVENAGASDWSLDEEDKSLLDRVEIA